MNAPAELKQLAHLLRVGISVAGEIDGLENTSADRLAAIAAEATQLAQKLEDLAASLSIRH